MSKLNHKEIKHKKIVVAGIVLTRGSDGNYVGKVRQTNEPWDVRVDQKWLNDYEDKWEVLEN